jgi:[ribosomal protein S18]-alanine N-acetyltransferase
VTAPVLEAASWRDIATLARLERELFPQDAWTEATWWAELAQRPRRDYTVARVDGALAGYAGLDLGGEVADVMTVAVDPAHRGTGLARELLGLVLRRAGSHGAREVLLEVRADNAPALRLYEGAGFAVVHTRRGYYRPGGVDALVMRKEVTDGG